jgi:hypothetical protein
MMRWSITAAAFLCLLPGALAAQPFELAPFGGYRFFGSLEDYSGATLESEDAPVFGGLVTYYLDASGEDIGLEFGFSRQDSEVDLSVPFEGQQTFDVKIDHWSVGAHILAGSSQATVRPLAGAFLGATHMTSSDGPGSVTRVLTGGQLGARVRPAGSRVGARLESRGYITLAGKGETYVGCGTGGCSFGFGATVFAQLELIAALSIALGPL